MTLAEGKQWRVKPLGFVSLFHASWRITGQSLAGNSTSWHVLVEVFPFEEFLPGSWSSSTETILPWSSLSRVWGLKTPAGGLGLPLPKAVKLKAEKCWEPELHSDFHVWKHWELGWGRAAGAPALPAMELWLWAAFPGCPQHPLHSSQGVSGAPLCGAAAAAAARDNVTPQLQPWELGDGVLVFLKWPFWEFPVCGHFQKGLFPAWFGPKPPIEIKPHFQQAGGLACPVVPLLMPHLLWSWDESDSCVPPTEALQPHGLWSYHNVAITA